MAEPQFQWEESICAPLGYPVEVYRGGFDEPFVPLNTGLATGRHGWGDFGSGMSYGIKPLPRRISAVWIAYMEDTVYSIDTAIDYDKMVRLFKQGLEWKDANGKFQHKNYEYVAAGIAPGGVVVVWVSGIGRTVEIGRYQGHKTVVPQEEINSLDSHEHLFFDPADRKNVRDVTIAELPEEVREARAGKPIPFGLWDTYRIKYNWQPKFTVGDGGKMDDGIFFDYLNGEELKMYQEIPVDSLFTEKAVPRRVTFAWWDKSGQLHGAAVNFDEEEMLRAFKTLTAGNPKAAIELEIRTDRLNTRAVAMLCSGDREIMLGRTNRKWEVL